MSGQSLASLVAGRAPAYWARYLSDHAARHLALRRACAWVEGFAAIRAGLHDAPLMGSCLAELTGGAPPPAEAVPESARPRPGRPAHQATAPARENRLAGDAPALRSGVPAARAGGTPRAATGASAPERANPAIAGLPRQIDGSLLARLARGSTALVGPEPWQHSTDRPSSARSQPTPERWGAPPLQPAGSGQRGRRVSDEDSPSLRARLRAGAPPLQVAGTSQPRDEALGGARLAQRRMPPRWEDEPAARRAWQTSLVARAERALRDAGPTITPLQLGAVALAQQLAVPVAGMAAPRDLLRQLAGIDLAAGADSSGAAGRAPPAPGPGAQPREASHTAADVPAGGRLSEAPGANGHASARQSQAPPVGSAPREPTAGPLPRGDGASHVALGAHVAEEQIERIAPPSLAPQLPPLLPPRLMGMPTLAVASEIARQGALAEATAGDDLDTLAAKIKHILDEEARRHGIDV